MAISSHHVQKLLAVLFVAAIPLLLIAGSVTYAFNEPRVYEYGFSQYDISLETGMEGEELKRVASEIRAYFNSADEPLSVRARVYGQERELFTPREQTHMQDVKHILWGVYGLGAGAALYLAIYAAVGFYLRRRSFGLVLARLAMWGSGATVALVVGVGLFSLVGFDSLFLWFHQVSFGNDFWQLDPNRHFLVMMFPQGFWQDATLFVGLLALAEAVLVGGVAGGWLLWSRRAARRPSEATVPDPTATN